MPTYQIVGDQKFGFEIFGVSTSTISTDIDKLINLIEEDMKNRGICSAIVRVNGQDYTRLFV